MRISFKLPNTLNEFTIRFPHQRLHAHVVNEEAIQLIVDEKTCVRKSYWTKNQKRAKAGVELRVFSVVYLACFARRGGWSCWRRPRSWPCFFAVDGGSEPSLTLLGSQCDPSSAQPSRPALCPVGTLLDVPKQSPWPSLLWRPRCRRRNLRRRRSRLAASRVAPARADSRADLKQARFCDYNLNMAGKI